MSVSTRVCPLSRFPRAICNLALWVGKTGVRISFAALSMLLIFGTLGLEGKAEESWQTGPAIKTAAQNGVVKIIHFRRHRKSVRISLGAGSIINTDGVVVTNRHVIEGASCAELTAITYDGYSYPCLEIIRSFPDVDLAIVRFSIPYSAIKAIIPFASDDPVSGEIVYALGHPEGSQWVITRGVISENPYSRDPSFLMHDASINHGNSGGPLMNENGQLVGMNTSSLNGTQNMNLAVKGDRIKSELNQEKIYFSTDILVLSPQQRAEGANRQFKKMAEDAERRAELEALKNRAYIARNSAQSAPVSRYITRPPEAPEAPSLMSEESRVEYFLFAAAAEGGVAYGQIGSRGSTAKDKNAELLSYGAVSATIGVRPFIAKGNSLLLGVTSRVGGLSTSAAKNIYLEQYRRDYGYIGRRANAKNVPLSPDGANFEEGKGSPFSEYLLTAGLCEWFEIGWGTGLQHFSFSDDAGDLNSIQASYHVSSVKFKVGAPFSFSLGASYLYSGLYQRPSVRYDAALGYSLSL